MFSFFKKKEWSLKISGKEVTPVTWEVIQAGLISLRQNDDSCVILKRNPGTRNEECIQAGLPADVAGAPPVYIVQTFKNLNGKVALYEAELPDLTRLNNCFRSFFEKGVLIESFFTEVSSYGSERLIHNRVIKAVPDLDFKKEIKKRIREDLRPFLKKNGFVLWKPLTYVRERNGLLQLISFEVHKTKIRPWSYFVPIYLPWTGVVTWGTCSSTVDVPYRGENPYQGYGDIYISDWPPAKMEWEYYNKALPKFDALIECFKNVILPEMDRVSSADMFAEILATGGYLWMNRVRPDDTKMKLGRQSGISRVRALQGAANDFLPHPIYDFVMNARPDEMSDVEADNWYHDYCNEVRKHLKLPLVKTPPAAPDRSVSS